MDQRRCTRAQPKRGEPCSSPTAAALGPSPPSGAPANSGRKSSCPTRPLPSGCSWPPRIAPRDAPRTRRSEEHTSELQSRLHLVCRLLLEKKKKKQHPPSNITAKTKDTNKSKSPNIN